MEARSATADAGRIEAICAALRAAAPACGAVRVLAIDGGAGAGKSTLARAVATALTDPLAAIVHTDDLLDGWQDQFTFWPRLRAQVLEPLAAGVGARYRRYDWNRGSFGDWTEVGVPRYLIVEGGSAIEACGHFASLGVLLLIERTIRERRWRERDGEIGPAGLRWLDAEDDYFAPPAQGNSRLT
jgi:hypothetical protein